MVLEKEEGSQEQVAVEILERGKEATNNLTWFKSSQVQVQLRTQLQFGNGAEALSFFLKYI